VQGAQEQSRGHSHGFVVRVVPRRATLGNAAMEQVSGGPWPWPCPSPAIEPSLLFSLSLLRPVQFPSLSAVGPLLG
jgi:hypothetical protein